MERAHRARLRARSPEREKLAQAIEALKAAQAHVRATEEARKENRKARSPLFHHIDGAAAAVEKAKADSAASAIARAKGEAAADAPRSVAQVRAAVDAAQEQLSVLEEADKTFAREADAARNRVLYAEVARDQAVALVVRSDPRTKELFAKLENVHAEFENLRRALGVVSPMLEGNDRYRFDTDWNDSWGIDLPAQRVWKAAIEGLRTNADAPLPVHFGLG